MTPEPDLIDTREAAHTLGYRSPSTISRMVAAGKLTPVVRGKGRTGVMLFRRTDVAALAEQRSAVAS